MEADSMRVTVKGNKTLVATVILASLQAAAPALAQTPAAAKAAAPETTESIVVQGQFLGAGAQSAMKPAIPVRDTPFTVATYTASFINALEPPTLAPPY